MNQQKYIKLLLADNSAEYRRSVRSFLDLEGYEVEEAGSLELALKMLATKEFELVLADLRMRDDSNPNDMSGLEIAKFASEHGIACILVTAFPSWELARVALRSVRAEPYAKDVITKGSDPQAVLDSISLALQRMEHQGSAVQTPSQPPLNGSGLQLDLIKRLVKKNGKLIKVSKAQYALLDALSQQGGGLCTYAELILAIYGETGNGKAEPQDKRLRNLVDRTSDKIDDEDHHYIEAVHGRGYMLNSKP